MKVTDKFVLFWSGEFSNWYKSNFEWHSTKFNCAEQAMMWAKADLFKDEESKLLILNCKDPKGQKKLGRKIKCYDDKAWSNVRLNTVSDILYAKFSQNVHLKQFLLETRDREIVEASPLDTIWGIGLDENNPNALDKSKWKGQNLLGQALMNARERIKNENSIRF